MDARRTSSAGCQTASYVKHGLLEQDDDAALMAAQTLASRWAFRFTSTADGLVEQYAEVAGRRNQVEAFFGWLERCFYNKDRHASWGRTAQLFNLIGAALLHNSQAWAHLAYRHPEQAEQLAAEIRELAEKVHGDVPTAD
ncbi:MAG: hypothetical protein JWQ93_2843 [Marmoricola sp.]|jgi:hypothetical protein|nr:hypothetical protein [Marmoricola sp.]